MEMYPRGFDSLEEERQGAWIGIVGNCTPTSIDEFPRFINEFSPRYEVVAVATLVCAYAFFTIAIMCENYFVPALESFCYRMNLSYNVAGATVMAVATSAPEFLINIIATFLTESDIGIGTIVGSLLFNLLAIPAICGLAVKKPLALDWWPATRDFVWSNIAMIGLLVVSLDGRIYWYESVVLLILYVCLTTCLINDRKVQYFIRGPPQKRKTEEELEIESIMAQEFRRQKRLHSVSQASVGSLAQRLSTLFMGPDQESVREYEPEPEKEAKCLSLCLECFKPSSDDIPDLQDLDHDPHAQFEETYDFRRWPSEEPWYMKIIWITSWPIHLAYSYTIPDCRRSDAWRMYPITLLMCIVWLCFQSYFTAWMITVIGYHLFLPESVMGAAFLALGTSIPEAIGSVLIMRKGYGSMAVCNAMSSNSLDILFSLPFPWLLKSIFLPVSQGPNKHYIHIITGGMLYISICCIAAVVTMYSTLVCTHFTIGRPHGLICLLSYIICVCFVIAIELNVFGHFLKKACPYEPRK